MHISLPDRIWAHLSLEAVNQEEMEDFWAGVLWALKIWLYLIVCLIMFPAMFGFSLGISETYMTILVKTLEVFSSADCFCCCFGKFPSWSLWNPDKIATSFDSSVEIVRSECFCGCAERSLTLRPVCPLQWATLKIQKAHADEQALKASASNGECKKTPSTAVLSCSIIAQNSKWGQQSAEILDFINRMSEQVCRNNSVYEGRLTHFKWRFIWSWIYSVTLLMQQGEVPLWSYSFW